MHIAIDISPLESGHSGRGVGVYTKLLIEALQTYEKDHTVSLVTHQHDIPETCNLVHYPYFDPFFLTLPFFRKYPSVVTIHDVIPLLYPDKFRAGIKGNIRFQLQKLSLKSIKRVLTDSKTSKTDIHRITKRSLNTIDVVYLASSISLSVKRHSAEISNYTDGNPYIMYVGDVNWNKNIIGLLTAFSQAKKTIKSLQLVLVGKSFENTELKEVKEINATIEKLSIASSIHKTGYVDSEMLVSFYSNALCLVHPSFYEGFGFPVVDALSLGCPVVTSNTSSLQEIAGPSVQVDPENPDAIANGIRFIAACSPQKRKKLITDGEEWVEQFTWKRVAQETIASYKKALL